MHSWKGTEDNNVTELLEGMLAFSIHQRPDHCLSLLIVLQMTHLQHPSCRTHSTSHPSLAYQSASTKQQRKEKP